MASLSKMLGPIFFFPRVTMSFIGFYTSLPIELNFMFMFSHEVTVELLIREKWWSGHISCICQGRVFPPHVAANSKLIALSPSELECQRFTVNEKWPLAGRAAWNTVGHCQRSTTLWKSYTPVRSEWWKAGTFQSDRKIRFDKCGQAWFKNHKNTPST